MNSETHNFNMPCGNKLHLTRSKDYFRLKTGKSGECKQILLEIIGQFIEITPRARSIEILRSYQCENALPGNKSCIDRLCKYISDIKDGGATNDRHD